jgi:hypothetical protein
MSRSRKNMIFSIGAIEYVADVEMLSPAPL